MLALLLSLPTVAKVLGTLIIILFLNWLLKNLLSAVIAGTLLLALWLGHPLSAMASIAGRRFFTLDSLFLTVVFIEVIGLSSLMAGTGVMRDLVQSIQSRFSRRLSFAALPAVIGLLPMPGGAVFSAPLVESNDQDRRLTGLMKSQVNYWFRHIWEFWWPLYPGVILAMSLSGLEAWQFVLMQAPGTLVMAASGYWFLLRRIPREKKDEPTAAGPKGQPLSLLLLPILIVVGVYIAIKLFLPSLAALSSYLPVGLGLLAAMICLQAQRGMGLSDWRQALFTPQAFSLALLVMVLRVYAAFIEAPLPGSRYPVELMRAELASVGIPLLAVTVLIPLISGLTMGLAVGTVGASFPIALSLLGAHPPLADLLSTIALVYGWGFVGMMLSPVHVCLIVTNDYFKSSLARSLAGLLAPSACLLLALTLISYLLKVFAPR